MKYVVIAGSFEYDHTWYRDPAQPFNAMMRQQGFDLLTPAFRWNGGILPIDWRAAADALSYLCATLPFEDRNFIAYSNGGEVVLYLAAAGFPIRTLTTVGTPCRPDVPNDTAEGSITYHQHIYSVLDPIQWLGSLDFVDPATVSTSFPRFTKARNYNLFDIGHGKVLLDPAYIAFWQQMGWLDAIRHLSTPIDRSLESSSGVQ